MNKLSAEKFKLFLKENGIENIVKVQFFRHHGVDKSWEEYLETVDFLYAFKGIADWRNVKVAGYDYNKWEELNEKWLATRNRLGQAFDEARELWGSIPASGGIPERDYFVLFWNTKYSSYLKSAADSKGFLHRFAVDAKEFTVGIFPSFEMRKDFEDFILAKLIQPGAKPIYYETLPQILRGYIAAVSAIPPVIESKQPKEAFKAGRPVEAVKMEEKDEFNESMVIDSTQAVEVKHTRKNTLKSGQIRVYVRNKGSVSFNIDLSKELLRGGYDHVAIVNLFNDYIGLAFNRHGEGIKVCTTAGSGTQITINSVNLVNYLAKKLGLKDTIATLDIATLGAKGNYYTVIINK